MSPAVDRAEARALVERVPVARLATVNPGLGVDVVPVTFALLDAGDDGVEQVVTAVDHKPKSTTRLRRLRNIAEHPGVTLLVDHYEHDWERLWWVRLRGRATVVVDGPLHVRAVDALVARYEQYRSMRPTGSVIVVSIEEWTAWRA